MKKLPQPQAEYEKELIMYKESLPNMDVEELVYEFFTFLDYEQEHPNSKLTHKPTSVICVDKEIMGPLYSLLAELRQRVGA